MKKLFILVLFPFITYSQTYREIISINSLDMFKKVMIENGYEFDQILDDSVIYGFNIVKDSIEGDKSRKWGLYDRLSNGWILSISKSPFLENLLDMKDDYDLIVDDIKEKCKYYKIQSFEGNDFVTYSCSESTYKGKIGFSIIDGSGVIVHIPDI